MMTRVDRDITGVVRNMAQHSEDAPIWAIVADDKSYLTVETIKTILRYSEGYKMRILIETIARPTTVWEEVK